MLDSIRRGSRWLTWIVIVTIGLVFVWFVGGGAGSQPGAPSGGNVVQVGDVALSVADFQRVRAQAEPRIRESFGDNIDGKMLRSILDSQALRALIETAILADAAGDLGLHVSQDEIQKIVTDTPIFRDEAGKFNRDAFDEFARYEYGSQRNFVATMRQDLLRQKLIRLLSEQATVSDGEARFAALYRLEEIRLAYVTLPTNALPAGDKLEAAEIQAYLDSHQDEIRKAYDERSAEFNQPERVRARHIALLINPGASEEDIAAIREAAVAVRARIEAGEDFAAVAIEVSDDTATKNSGGDLGIFARGETTPEIEEAAFALEAGGLSEVVQSDSAFHIVLVDEKLPGGTQSFEDVQLMLAEEKAIERAARERADAATAKLAEAVRGGTSLEDAARAQQLTLERTELLRRRADGFVPKLGASQELLNKAFSLSLDAPSSDQVFQVGPRLVMIQLLERNEPEEAGLEVELMTERTRLLNTKRNRLVQEWIDNHRAALEASGELLIDTSQVIRES